ncbi:MAG: hypothetical protein WCJ61_06710 [Paludibacter sp.]
MENLTDKQLKSKEYEDQERDLNLKIMQVTLEIKENYPELTKFLKETPQTNPSDQNMELKLKDMKTYYDSLNTVLNDYISEQA